MIKDKELSKLSELYLSELYNDVNNYNKYNEIIDESEKIKIDERMSNILSKQYERSLEIILEDDSYSSLAKGFVKKYLSGYTDESRLTDKDLLSAILDKEFEERCEIFNAVRDYFVNVTGDIDDKHLLDLDVKIGYTSGLNEIEYQKYIKYLNKGVI